MVTHNTPILLSGHRGVEQHLLSLLQQWVSTPGSDFTSSIQHYCFWQGQLSAKPQVSPDFSWYSSPTAYWAQTESTWLLARTVEVLSQAVFFRGHVCKIMLSAGATYHPSTSKRTIRRIELMSDSAGVTDTAPLAQRKHVWALNPAMPALRGIQAMEILCDFSLCYKQLKQLWLTNCNTSERT